MLVLTEKRFTGHIPGKFLCYTSGWNDIDQITFVCIGFTIQHYVREWPDLQRTHRSYPDSKAHVAHMGPTRVLSNPGVGPMNLAIRVYMCANRMNQRSVIRSRYAFRHYWSFARGSHGPSLTFSPMSFSLMMTLWHGKALLVTGLFEGNLSVPRHSQITGYWTLWCSLCR